MGVARSLGLLVVVAVLAAGCTTKAEIRVGDEAPKKDPLVPSPSYVIGPPATTVAGWTADPAGIVVQLDIHATDRRSGLYSFYDDGRVVRVADRTVFMDRRDLTTWRISHAELATVLGALDAVGVRTAAPGDFGDPSVAGSGPTVSVSFTRGPWQRESSIGGDDGGLVGAAYAVTRAPRHGVHLWTPPAIGFLAGPPEESGRSPLTAADPFRPWPLKQGIRRLSTGTDVNAYGERRLALCLVGGDATRVWRRLFTGENSAYLRVDDGHRWELEASVVLPNYVVSGSPCGPR